MFERGVRVIFYRVMKWYSRASRSNTTLEHYVHVLTTRSKYSSLLSECHERFVSHVDSQEVIAEEIEIVSVLLSTYVSSLL